MVTNNIFTIENLTSKKTSKLLSSCDINNYIFMQEFSLEIKLVRFREMRDQYANSILGKLKSTEIEA